MHIYVMTNPKIENRVIVDHGSDLCKGSGFERAISVLILLCHVESHISWPCCNMDMYTRSSNPFQIGCPSYEPTTADERSIAVDHSVGSKKPVNRSSPCPLP